MPQPFFFLYNWFQQTFLHCLWEVCNLEHSVRTQSRVPNNDEHKWTPRPGEKNRGRERDKWTTRECLRGRERQERCLHLLIHAERTCLCLWALGDVLKAAVMNAALFSHTSLISASLSAILLSAAPGRAVSLFTLVVVLKWVALRINLLCRQHKYFLKRKM